MSLTVIFFQAIDEQGTVSLVVDSLKCMK